MRSIRKRYFAASGFCALALVVLAIVTMQVKRTRDCESCTVTTSEPSAVESTVASEVPVQADDITAIRDVLRDLGDFTDFQGIYRQYVLVAPDLSDEAIINVARQLHEREPDTWWYLMDSDAEFDTMMAALPETAEGTFDNWPREYVREHFVARVMLELRGDGQGNIDRVWLVEGGPRRPRLEAGLG